jgi:O-glycosyl hydrolase
VLCVCAVNAREDQAVVKCEIRADRDRDRQKIDGFGACAAGPERYFMASKDYPNAGKQKVLDLLFHLEKGAGLSVCRVGIPTGKASAETPDYSGLPLAE